LLPLQDGGFVVAGHFRTPELFGYPLHLVNRAGVRVKSFGAADRSINDPASVVFDRVLASSRLDGHFWAVRQDGYAFEEWATDGTLRRTLHVDRPWFPESSAPRGLPWSERPRPFVLGINERNDGTILVLIQRAHRDWKPDATRADHTAIRSIAEFIPYFEYVLEVVDGTTGALRSATVVDGDLLLSVLADGRVFGIREGPDGTLHPLVLDLPTPATMSLTGESK
jgi:hypothetical protein